MDRTRFEVLTAVMAAAGAGDSAAVFRLYDEFGGLLAVLLRKELRRQGVRRIDEEDLDGLVLDTCVVLFDIAPAWDPRHGVPPWTWARARMVELVRSWTGTHAEPFDDAVDETIPTPGIAGSTGELAEPAVEEVLRLLAAEREDCRVLAEALALLPDRSRAILLEVRLQACMGDPSPSQTVASDHGLRPDHVRQLAKRARDRLRALAATEPRFAALADMALVA